MRVSDRLAAKLEAALSPERLAIHDFSAAHAGHAGARPGGESHFEVEIVAEAFAGQSRVARQRLVLDAAAELLRDEIHALTIKALTPAEWAARPGSAT